MKKGITVLLLILVLCGSNHLSGQSTKALFSLPELRLSYQEYDDVASIRNHTYYFVQDTVIDGDEVLQFKTTRTGSYEYFSINNGKVKQVWPSHLGVKDRVLFDFDLEIGDTITVRESHNLSVTDKYTVVLGDSLARRVLHLQGDLNWDWMWIEGIGDVNLPLSSYLGFSFTSGYNIVCAESQNGIFYVNEKLKAYCEKYRCPDLSSFFTLRQSEDSLYLTNRSAGAEFFEWNMPDGTISTDHHPTFKFTESGCFPITLTVDHSCDCGPKTFTRVVEYCSDSLWVNKFSSIGLDDISFLNSEIGYAIDSRKLLKTNNGGRDWSELFFPTAANSGTRIPRFIITESENTLMLLCYHQAASSSLLSEAILMSYDNGLTWEEKVDNSHAISAGAMSKDGLAIAIGTDSTYFISSDRGKNWTTLFFDEDINISQVEYLDSQVLKAGGVDRFGHRGKYRLLHSEDNGINWTKTEFLDYSGNQLHCFHFIDEQVGFVGGTGFLLKTDNAGSSWHEIGLKDNREIRKIAFKDNNEGWLIGLSGLIMHTRDGGETWVHEYCSNNASNRDLELFDDSAYILIAGKGLYDYQPDPNFENCLSSLDEKSLIKPITAFPNPTTGVINFDPPVKAQSQLCIYDLMGRLHYQNQLGFSSTELSTSNLENGLYLLEIIFPDNSRQVLRILKLGL